MCALVSVPVTICVDACGPQGVCPCALSCVSFPVTAKQQDVVSPDSLPWMVGRVMLFHETPVLHPCPSLCWTPGGGLFSVTQSGLFLFHQSNNPPS